MINLVANVGRAGPGTTGAINTSIADFIICALANRTTVNIPPSDSLGNVWYPMSPVAAFDGFTLEFWIAARALVGSSHTFTCSGSQTSLCVAAFFGLKQAPINMDASITDITPSEHGCLLISGSSCPGTEDPSNVGGGFVVTDHFAGVDGVSMGIGLAYLVQETAAEVAPSIWAAGDIAQLIAAFSRRTVPFDSVTQQLMMR